GQSVVLEGEECLVFFLGGIQTTNPPNCVGFSTDPFNPASLPVPGSGETRKGPYFNFKANRLVLGPSGKFLMYNDPYGTPYAYYSSYKLKNGYSRYGTNDCPTLAKQFGLTQGPYYSAAASATQTT